MPTKAILSVPIPCTDLCSLLLHDIPDVHNIQERKDFDQPFLLSAEHPTRSISLIELKHLVKCFASGVQRADLRTGGHVMLVSPNFIQAIPLALGIIAAGNVFTAAQPDLKVREYIDQINRDEAAYLFVCAEQPQCSVILQAWLETGRHVDGKVWLFDETSETECEPKLIKVDHRSFAVPHWTTLIDREHGEEFQWRRLQTAEECNVPCMLYTTSGTSGLRKAAVFTHRNLVASFTASSFRAREDGIAAAKSGISYRKTSITRILHTVSISRGLGTTYPFALILSAKARPTEVYFMAKTYVDMTPYLDRIQNLNITDLSLAPFTLARLFKEQDNQASLNYDFSSLRSVNAVGAPSSQRNLTRVQSFLIQNGASESIRCERSLGITEACSLVSTWRLTDKQNSLEGYQGRLEPNIEAKIIKLGNDEDAWMDEAAAGESGELWLRGPSFIRGYYRNDAATQAAFTADGWFKTGDVGYLDGDKLFLVDRKKDILKTPDNIPPAYIEGVLMEHPDILDAGVIGIYQPNLELQLVRAYLVKRAGSQLSEDHVVAWMKRESADTAHLTGGVEFVSTLPRNESGKLLRKVIREWAAKTVGRNANSLTLSRSM